MMNIFNKMAAPVNGVLVRFKGLPTAVRRFCVPALLHSDDQVCDVAVFGSAFLFRYRGHNFALCTRHQLGKGATARSGEEFTVLYNGADNRMHGLTPNNVTKIQFQSLDHENLSDIFLAEYEDRRGEFDIRKAHLSIDLSDTLASLPDVKLMFAIGYPLGEVDYKFALDGDGMPIAADVIARWVKVYLEQSPGAPLDTENRRPMVPHRRSPSEPVDPNGMSGAPVFFIALAPNNEVRIGFAGIITHARTGRYMVYDSAIIRQVVDAYIDQQVVVRQVSGRPPDIVVP